jgi:threonine dehydratase
LHARTVDAPIVTPQDVDEARTRIAGHVRTTPVLRLERGAFGLPGEIVLKLELLQHTGSFKPRGAFNKMLSSSVPEAGVIAASGGNFGLAVAHASHELGHRAEIFVPESSPPIKARRIREAGAEVTLVPGYYDDAQTALARRAEETGALVMHPFDQPEVVAGQGTIAAELADQVHGVETVLVAIGGGGLIGGMAGWYAGNARVVGVEPDLCPTMSEALRVGRPTPVEVGGYAADSLGARRAGDVSFSVCVRYVEHVILVPDDAIRDAQHALWERTRVLAEPGGAAAFAALLTGRYRPDPEERVVVVVCGGNTDGSWLFDAEETDGAIAGR